MMVSFNSLLYRLLYRLGMARWDSGITPPEVIRAFQEETIPAGAALDLGCGTGTNVIYLAKQGRQAIGIDFVPRAIAEARAKARRAGMADSTQFYVADVTKLAELKLPPCVFALDMGCFHGLRESGRASYAEGLADVLVPGGLYMLYTLDRRKQGPVTFGMDPEKVPEVFTLWFTIERSERGVFWDRVSTWFWMRRNQN